ncbi:uncharacterized protein [Procambarus clarkii]|uniref:uncharacterized protein n=1 Tax=Procambarus clarkii TaxID=6728 RepID=UPI003742997A
MVHPIDSLISEVTGGLFASQRLGTEEETKEEEEEKEEEKGEEEKEEEKGENEEDQELAGLENIKVKEAISDVVLTKILEIITGAEVPKGSPISNAAHQRQKQEPNNSNSNMDNTDKRINDKSISTRAITLQNSIGCDLHRHKNRSMNKKQQKIELSTRKTVLTKTSRRKSAKTKSNPSDKNRKSNNKNRNNEKQR